MRSRTEPPGRVTEHANIPTKDRASLDAPSFALIAVYAALSAGGLATALFVGWYISVHLRELQEVIPQAYCILLLILGLAAAAFLFGAMRSTATVQGRQLGIAFDVGGPAAGALLVIVGGFWLTRAPPTFDLTVRLSGPEVRSDIANSWIVVDLGQLHPRISPDQQGDATQKQVGENHRHDPVRLQLESKQYRLSNPNKTYTIPSDNVLRVDVERIPPALPGSDHILFWWAGDGPKPRIGDITADSSGAVGYAEGIDGRAFDFSGTGFLEAAASKLPIGSKDRTIELWFLPTSLPQDLRKQMIFLCYGAIAKDSEQICLLYSKEFGIGASNFGQGNTRPGANIYKPMASFSVDYL